MQLPFEIDPTQRYQVIVGPALVNEEQEAPTNLMAQLTQVNAITQDYRPELAPQSLQFSLFPLIWLCWFPTCIPIYRTVS